LRGIPKDGVDRRGKWSRALRPAWKLTPEAHLDQTKIGVVAAAVRSEDTFVSLGNNSETPILVRRDRTLELFGTIRVDDESTSSHRASVDTDVRDTAKWSEVAKAKSVDLTGTGKYMSRSNLSNANAFSARYNFDSEITDTHRDAPSATFGEL
jgi:hypothetical protein